MSLAFTARVFDQHGVVRPFRLRQDGCSDFNLIIESQCVNQPGRGLGHGREPVGKQRLRGCFDLFDQAMKDIVENVDLLVGIVRNTIQKEIGDPAQGFHAARHGTVRQSILELVKKVG